MSMDEAWREVYEKKASEDLPEHEMACWSKQGFEELVVMTDNIVNSLKGIKTILDVGCGPGTYCRMFHTQGYNITGVDYSEKMIEAAKKKAPQIKFVVGNGYSLPFPDDSFDLVISIGTLQCLYDYEKFVKELIRVSKKAVVISTLYRGRKHPAPIELLRRKLYKDSWPTRDYHPSEIIPFFEEADFNVRTKIYNKNSLIQDGFFLIAQKDL